MSTTSKFPKIEYVPFDHGMLKKTHAKFEIYHADERRKSDPNDPSDIVNALQLAIQPLGWQIGSMAIVRPTDDVPVEGREKVCASLDQLIELVTDARRSLADGEPAEDSTFLKWNGDDLLEAIDKEIERLCEEES